MACGGCRKKNQNDNSNVNKSPGDLSRYAYLTPRQLRMLEEQNKKLEDK